MDFVKVELLKLHDGTIFVPGIVTLSGTLNNGMLNGANVELSYNETSGVIRCQVTKGGQKRTVIIPQSSANYLVLAP